MSEELQPRLNKGLTQEAIDRALYGDAADCVRRLGESRQQLLGLIEGLDDETFFRQPDADAWSAGLVVEHVALAERSFARVIGFLRKAVARGVGPEQRPVEARWRPDGRPIAPEIVTPKGDSGRDVLMGRLADIRLLLLEEADESGVLLEHPYTLPHGFFGNQNGLGWLRVAAYHERVHIQQVQRILQSPGV